VDYDYVISNGMRYGNRRWLTEKEPYRWAAEYPKALRFTRKEKDKELRKLRKECPSAKGHRA
jgi:hypothetical protein